MKLAATHRPLGSFGRPLLALRVTIKNCDAPCR